MHDLTPDDILLLKDLVARTRRRSGGMRAAVRRNPDWTPEDAQRSAAKNDLKTVLWTLERARTPDDKARAEELVAKVRARLEALGDG